MKKSETRILFAFCLILLFFLILQLQQTPAEPLVESVPVTSYIYQWFPLRDFENTATLKSFLQRDQASQLHYTKNFTCLSFALTLIQNAEKEGYRLYLFVDRLDDRGSHALVMAYLVDEEVFQVVEPQSDRLKWQWPSVQIGEN